MIETHKKTDIPFDDQNYQSIEYYDCYHISPVKKTKIKDLGAKVASTNAFFFDYLKEYHIPTAFIKKNSENSLMFINNKEFPFRVKMLNSADKRIAKIFGLKDREEMKLPIFELHFGNGKDSLISESHLVAFDLCNSDDLKLINRICSKVNAVLKSFFERRNEIMPEMSVQFGKFEEKIFLTGDFSPSSLKILPKDDSVKFPDPYKLSTTAEIKKYTDHLFNIASVN